MLRIFLTFGTLGAFTGVGMAWSVLRIVYPTFLMTNPSDFLPIHRLQERRILEVAPILFIELASTAALVWFAPAGQRIWVALAMLALLAALGWGIGVQIPAHRILDKGGFDQVHLQRMARNEWVRFLAVSVHALAYFVLLFDNL
jgi:hypothetical protein